jgi:hypothetical protein
VRPRRRRGGCLAGERRLRARRGPGLAAIGRRRRGSGGGGGGVGEGGGAGGADGGVGLEGGDLQDRRVARSLAEY